MQKNKQKVEIHIWHKCFINKDKKKGSFNLSKLKHVFCTNLVTKCPNLLQMHSKVAPETIEKGIQTNKRFYFI